MRSRALGPIMGAGLALVGTIFGGSRAGAEPRASLAAGPATEVCVRLPGHQLLLRPLADNAIRVRFVRPGTPESPSPVLAGQPPTPHFAVTESRETITVATARMSVAVNRATGRLSFADSNGRVFLAEAANGPSLEPSTLHGQPTFVAGETFASPPGERLFGSGQFQGGHLDLRDLPRRLTQVNSQIAIPFLLSSRGYGLLWLNDGLTELNPATQPIALEPIRTDGKGAKVEVTTTEGTQTETRHSGGFAGKFLIPQPGRYAFMLDVGRKMARRWHVEVDGRTVVDFANLWLPPTTSWHADLAAGEHTVTVEGAREDRPTIYFRPAQDVTVLRSPVAEAVDYVVFAGHADQVIASYRLLTGPAPLLPEWAYGYIHCRERFKSQQELLETAAEFRRRRLPMDVIVQDWQYWGRYGWNAMRFDERDYPDPAAMVRQLHALHARLMLSVWSKIDPDSDVGRPFAADHLFIPGTQWVDFFNPAAAARYWQDFDRQLVSLGIDAWWLDATEPENDDLVGRTTFAGPGETVRDLYPLVVTRTVYDGLRRARPNQRVFILTRSAFAGEQRYAAATWSGDIGNGWDTLRRQIPAGLDYAAAGMPYWTTDGGGFFRPAGQYTDPGYHERFIRWLQFATFCPLMRVHGYQTDTEFWHFGEQVEQQAHRCLDLRYRLLPYLYSEAARVTFDGSTLMRPLVMDFPDDATALAQKYEYLFGPALLVAPVLQAGAKRWKVYLPENRGGWIDFWTGRRLPGGQTVDGAAPLDQIPLHVRAGSIIPLGPVEQYTREKPASPIELRVYPGANGRFTLYEDDGVSYGYEQGARATIPMQWDDGTGTLTLGARTGSFAGMLRDRVFRVILVGPGRGVGIAPSDEVDAEVRYRGDAVSIGLHPPVPRAGK